jgi:hypothetical protein
VKEILHTVTATSFGSSRDHPQGPNAKDNKLKENELMK